MRSSSRFLGLGLVVFAVLLAAAWWSVRPGRSARLAEIAARSEPRGPALELADAPDPVRAPTQGDATTNGASSPSAARARTGTVVVRVEDAATRAPLAGIALRVARERGGDKLLATGTTDERGEARFAAVEANTVIVEARRSPPHARAFGAVWLEGDETETVVLSMGSGGRFAAESSTTSERRSPARSSRRTTTMARVSVRSMVPRIPMPSP